MERETNRKKWCYPAISLGLAVLYAVLLLCAVQQWLSPFLFLRQPLCCCCCLWQMRLPG